MAALGDENFRLTGTITGSGSSASISGLAPANGCTPSFTGARSNLLTSFTWREWLYGMFFNAATKKTYAAIYNEFYGPYAYDDPDGWYSADGLATSSDYGNNFYRAGTPPNHVISRPTFLFAPGDPARQTGYGGITGFVLSPKDNYFYTIVHYESQNLLTSKFCLIRTQNLDDPTSWRAWDGANFTKSFYPNGYDCTAGVSCTISPLYLGWSVYFQKFIAVGWGFGDTGWEYALSDNLINWDAAVHIMDAPGGSDVDKYPSIVDPSQMLNSADSRAASNDLVGQTPYLTYIHNFTSGIYRQELRIQKLQFSGAAPTPTPVAIPNVSIRAIVGTGNKNLVAGFAVAGTGTPNPKTLIIRGIGPSLGAGSLPTPTISLYNASGTLVATNHGWTTLSSTNQALLGGLAPSNPNDSAVVYGNFTPGLYTAVLSGGTGLGLIEIYDVTWQSPTPSLNSSIANFSARGYVTSGSGAMILGFTSNRLRTLDIRATSLSTLAPVGLLPALADPTLTFYKGPTQTDYNDNWQTDPDHVAIMNDGLAPGNVLESAFRPPILTVPTLYTAVCAGKPNAPDGYALVELYDVSP